MEIDRQLIFAAWRVTTGANVHRINTLIFQYEMGVRIAQAHRSPHSENVAKEYERRLRQLVQASTSDSHVIQQGVNRSD